MACVFVLDALYKYFMYVYIHPSISMHDLIIPLYNVLFISLALHLPQIYLLCAPEPPECCCLSERMSVANLLCAHAICSGCRLIQCQTNKWHAFYIPVSSWVHACWCSVQRQWVQIYCVSNC